MRATLTFAACLGALGCGTGNECRDLQVQPVDEARMCLGPPTSAAGIRACLDPEQPRGMGLFPVCLADPGGRLYRAWVSSSEWIEGTGWSHSDIPHASTTLSADTQRRCSETPPSQPSAPPSCLP
jgi:hypothetical protein